VNASTHRQRLENALEGGIERPAVRGLSFLSPEVLRQDGSPLTSDPAEALAQATEGLDVDFAFVQADEPWAPDAVAALRRRRLGSLWGVDGPLWPVLRARGLGETLKATAWDPAGLDPALEEVTAGTQDTILAGSECGADAIVIADDVAGSSGPLVSPDYFNEHLVPRYALLVATAASVGMRSVFHSDGDVRAFLPGVARAGFIGVHGGGGMSQESFERLLQLTREQGLALIGGIDAGLLGEGTDAASRMGTRAAVLASAGGLLIADDGGISTPEQFAGLAVALQAGARG
jgi:uroporphyrinogen decarboxylase